MKVILVRHAQTQWNQRGIIQGHMDSPVTKRGMLETSALLAALTDAAYPTDCVYASPLGRAWHMGQALADCFLCPFIAEPALKEQAFGHYEGMTRKQIQYDYPNEAELLFGRDAQFCPAGGESLTQASQRVINFLHHQQAIAAHQTICVVSHGQVSQGVLALLKEGRVDNFSNYTQLNASYSILDLVGDKCVSLRWGIATHLLKLL
ncbi:histidine phosphatase family protein [Serratia fonticola]|uniref:histidine phosphatase family protein n=1 Tax=Serratia fonticola TaxID=47917 RepID=UPI0015C64689|nr:histidine phosphatase family protein [Serratia fonticola]MBC3380057.1 histidine phosphatase family protein [Serratia fonticola]NYA39256.1 histidine phosphatase family protein [Serratia fonticola]